MNNMLFEKEIAKNGQWTLKINGRYIYSKYAPEKEAIKNITAEFDTEASSYVLIGLGFGYHLKALCNLINVGKSVQVVVLNEEEKDLFNSVDHKFPFDQYTISIGTFESIKWDENLQIIIPQVWMNVIEDKHPLYFLLRDIKMKQVTYKQSAAQMLENFSLNSILGNFDLMQEAIHLDQRKYACLVSSGPTLKDTAHLLKEQREKLYILCVGSALNFLINQEILPDSVIISDPKDSISNQIKYTDYSGTLFYLSTANHKTVQAYTNKKIILLQEGYSLAEQMASKLSYPLLETGGSVATLGFSLLEYLGFSNVFLFGQDLGFISDKTHVSGSSSGRTISTIEKLIHVPANNGEQINTTLNLYSYLKWFEEKFMSTKVKVYNTAYHGAVISNTTLVTEEEFLNLLE